MQRPKLRDTDLKVTQYLQQERLEFLVSAVDFIDQQHRWLRSDNGLEERAWQQKVAREKRALLTLQQRHSVIEGGRRGQERAQLLFEHLHVQQLLTVFPLVQGFGFIEPLVTLQTNELRLCGLRQHFGKFRFAHTRRALHQQRPLQLDHQEDCRRRLFTPHVVRSHKLRAHVGYRGQASGRRGGRQQVVGRHSVHLYVVPPDHLFIEQNIASERTWILR